MFLCLNPKALLTLLLIPPIPPILYANHCYALHPILPAASFFFSSPLGLPWLASSPVPVASEVGKLEGMDRLHYLASRCHPCLATGISASMKGCSTFFKQSLRTSINSFPLHLTVPCCDKHQNGVSVSQI